MNGGRLTWLVRWIVSYAGVPDPSRRVDWPRVVPYLILHLACLAVFWVGASGQAVALAAAFFAVRMFAITGFYHRYFSHRAFKTSRVTQFAFAVLGAAAVLALTTACGQDNGSSSVGSQNVGATAAAGDYGSVGAGGAASASPGNGYGADGQGSAQSSAAGGGMAPVMIATASDIE